VLLINPIGDMTSSMQHVINIPLKSASGGWQYPDNAYHQFNENVSRTVQRLD
jgi:hypothetical protein